MNKCKMQLVAKHYDQTGKDMMIGYALLNNQLKLLNIIESKTDSLMRSCYVKDHIKHNQISSIAYDTFKSASDQTARSDAGDPNFYLVGTIEPNKLFFLRMDHSEDFGIKQNIPTRAKRML